MLAVNVLVLPVLIEFVVKMQKWPTLSQHDKALVWLCANTQYPTTACVG